jgi:hypothetical protein
MKTIYWLGVFSWFLKKDMSWSRRCVGVLEYYNNTRLFHKGKGQGWERCIEDLVPGSVDIQIPGYWLERSGG